MENYEIININADEEKIRQIADFADSVWHDTYDEMLPFGQVDYMILKFQSESVIENDIIYNGYVYYAAYQNGSIIGYCAAKGYRDEGRIFLSKIYVKRTERGRGLARSFVNRIIEDFGNEHYSSVYLTVNRNNHCAIEAYKHLGFLIAEEVDTNIGNGFEMNDYIMERVLSC